MELYKYCKSEHMEQLFARESLRIGTLFNWRSSGKHGEMVKDTEDGRIALNGNLIVHDWTYLSFQIVDSDPVAITGSGENQLRHFRNTMVRCDDVYTFSTSSSYSEEERLRWRDEEGYDACYKIHSLTEFLVGIYAGLGDCNFVLLGPACYYDETAANNVFEGVFHPALLKRKARYGNQNEVRFIWEPKAHAALREVRGSASSIDGAEHAATREPLLETLSPRMIVAPGIAKCCVPHARFP